MLDLGSGTGHLSARLERELGLEVVTADVSDIHVVGPPPVSITDGVLPFDEGTFSATLLLFMLTYPNDPAGVLSEAARVTRGPIILMQSLHSGRLGYVWLRAGVPLDIRGVPRFEGCRLRSSGRGVHHASAAFLYRAGAWAGSGHRRAADPVAVGAASATERLPGGRRLDPRASLRSVCRDTSYGWRTR